MVSKLDFDLINEILRKVKEKRSIGETLPNEKFHISLKGISPLDTSNKPITYQTRSLDSLDQEFINGLESRGKQIINKYTETLNEFRKYHCLSVGESFVVDYAGNNNPLEIVNIGEGILAIDENYVCEFNNIDDLWTGGSGVCFPKSDFFN